MKHKVSELVGAQLDEAVAHAELEEFRGRPVNEETRDAVAKKIGTSPFHPSSDWTQGGPIIEREHIGLTANMERLYCALAPQHRQPWIAEIQWDYPQRQVRVWQAGPTPLVAAMRAYVASKFGESVDLYQKPLALPPVVDL